MFNLANILTASNLLAGSLSIVFALTGRFELAVYFILLGAVFDFLDGFVARIMKSSGEFGKQLDSLADVVTFGLAPGLLMMAIMVEVLMNPLTIIDESQVLVSNEMHQSFAVWMEIILGNSNFADGVIVYLPFVALAIPFFSLFRLAKFNLDKRQSFSFRGVPTPLNAIFFLTFPLLYVYNYPETNSELELFKFIFNPVFISSLIIIMSLLLISEVSLFSLKFKNVSWKGNEIRCIFLLISLVLIPIFLTWSLALIVFLYLILSFVENTFLNNNKNEI